MPPRKLRRCLLDSKFICPPSNQSDLQSSSVVFPETTRSSPRPYITTSIFVFGFSAETSLIHRRTACCRILGRLSQIVHAPANGVCALESSGGGLICRPTRRVCR